MAEQGLPAAEPLRFEVPAALVGERVDRALALLTDWSRSDIAVLAAQESVLVDGRAVGKSHRLAARAVVEVTAEPPVPGPPRPEPMDLDLRHVDDHVVVLSKSPGLVVHPAGGHESGTLVNGLLARYPEIAGVGDPARPGIVHRLDRDTSGLMVVARSSEAYDGLVAALARRDVERRYLALVWGEVASTRGTIDAPIGRSSTRRTRMAVSEGGKEAVTNYTVLERPEPATLLECTLETGRTHQIRVHLAAIGHPVVGDVAYGGGREGLDASRPFLHAVGLAFTHPVTGETMRFEDDLPDDLVAVLDEARGGTTSPGDPPTSV